MKSTTINLGASWSGSIRTWQDGDIFRETNYDVVTGDLADRLGYLKTYADGKASLAGTNAWTGVNTFSPSGGGLISVILYRQVALVDAGTDAVEAAKTFISKRKRTLPDADSAVTIDAETFVVPQITGNRTYTFGSYGGNAGRCCRIVRPRTADAFTVTIKNSASATIAVIAASQQGAVEIEYGWTSDWVPTFWTSNVSSIATTLLA